MNVAHYINNVVTLVLLVEDWNLEPVSFEISHLGNLLVRLKDNSPLAVFKT